MTDTIPMAHVVAPGRVELLPRPMPEPGFADVLIQVRAVTLCGSDLHIFKGKHPAAALPVSVGHEIAGEVIAVGEGVTRVRIGDRVAIEPVIACGACHFCQRGQYHLCTDISFQYRRGQGGLSTHFCAPERWVHRLPERANYAEGALLEPLSVALHALKVSGLKLGQSCAIFGAGAIGLLLLQAARLAGAEPVFIVDLRPFRLAQAMELGAAAALDNREGKAVEQILDMTAGLGVEVAFEAVGLPVTLQQTLQSLRKGGKATLVGLFEQAEVLLPANIFVQREISLAGSQGYNWNFQEAVLMLAARRVDLQRLVTHRFSLENVQDAFELLADSSAEAVKILVEVDH